MPKRSFWEWVLKGIDNWWPLSFLEPRFLHKPSNPHLLYYRKHHKNQKLKKTKTKNQNPQIHYYHKHKKKQKLLRKDVHSRTRGWCVSEFWSWDELGEKIKQSLFLHLRGQGRDVLLSEKQTFSKNASWGNQQKIFSKLCLVFCFHITIVHLYLLRKFLIKIFNGCGAITKSII